MVMPTTFPKPLPPTWHEAGPYIDDQGRGRNREKNVGTTCNFGDTSGVHGAPRRHIHHTDTLRRPPLRTLIAVRMKAAVHEQYGPPEVVSIVERPTPRPTAGSFLVRIRATTVNRTDSGFRSAEYVVSRLFSGLLRPRQTILGCEYAGEVVEVGSGVTTVRVGDRIFGYDESRFGGHAEYKVVQATDTFGAIPDGMDYTQAAAMTEGSHLALRNLRVANVGAGTSVLVYGATGAIGTAAVQIARSMGAVVTAVCATPYIDMVAGLGAHRVWDYTTPEFERQTDRFDLFFDAVGKRSWAFAKPRLAQRGIYISTEFGPGGQNPFLALLTPLFGGKRLMFPLPTMTQADIDTLRDLAITGAFRPVIDHVVPLEKIVDAYRYVETGQKIGNVVISVP